MLTRALLLLLCVWVVMLLTGYGILTNRQSDDEGFNLRCEYLTGKGLVNADFIFSNTETDHERCPLFKKNEERIEM